VNSDGACWFCVIEWRVYEYGIVVVRVYGLDDRFAGDVCGVPGDVCGVPGDDLVWCGWSRFRSKGIGFWIR